MIKKIFLLLTLTITTCSSYSNSYSPLVINYKRSEYNALSQNWAVAFDNNGIAYFGNSGGLLEFDGKEWKLHQHMSKSAIRSLYFDKKNNRLYSGCFEDFGYWERNQYGELIYTSLTSNLDYTFSEERIWSIKPYKDEILFQSFSALFSYNIVTKIVKSIPLDGEIMFLNSINENVFLQIYVNDRKSGIAKYDEGKLSIINNSLLAQNGTFRCFTLFNNEIILGDGKSGLYILKNNKINFWECQANQYLPSTDVNCAVQIDSSRLAIGTLQNGVFIINTKGEILNHFNRQSKLENNTVLGMGVDHEKNLWLAMDNGITFLDLHPSVEYKIDLENAPSAIYSVIKHKGYLYIGTNNGVLYSNFDKSLTDLDFTDLKPLPGIPGHIWKLDLLNNELLCSSNDGIYSIDKENITPLSKTSGSTDFITYHTNSDDWLLESTYNNIRVSRRVNNKWKFSHHVEGFYASCRFIEMDHTGYLWLSHEIKGLTRLKLSEDLKKVIARKEFGTSSGLPTNFGLNVFKFSNQVIVTTGEEIYTFDYLNDKMVPYQKLNSSLGRFKKAVRIVNVDNQHFWAITKNEAAYIENKLDSITIKQILTLNEPYSFPDKYQNISITDNNSVLCLENGVAIIPNDGIEQSEQLPLSISSVSNEIAGASESSNKLPLYTTNPIQVKNKYNSFIFCIKTVNFGPNKINYQYRIKNLNNNWIDTKSENIHHINNIPAGEYIYQAKAMYSNGTTSNIVEYKFEVLPKWYASNQGIITIIIILVGSITFLILFNKRIIRLQTSEIEEKHQEKHKQDKLTIEQLKNDVLEKELENLQEKLTISANSLVEKDKSITKIKDELNKIYKKLEGRFPQKDYKKVLDVIENQMTKKRDILDFEQHFRASQSGFYDKLKKEYPDLSPSDLRLCSLLKMNMNSKEISMILGITTRSVEVSRYRLRKKMNLNPEDNLSDIIMGF